MQNLSIFTRLFDINFLVFSAPEKFASSTFNQVQVFYVKRAKTTAKAYVWLQTKSRYRFIWKKTFLNQNALWKDHTWLILSDEKILAGLKDILDLSLTQSFYERL